MKIIIYNPHTKEWNEFINSLGCNEEERNKAIKDHIVEICKEISALEFVNNNHSYSKLSYEFIGEPCNPLEKTIKFVYSGPDYINMKEDFLKILQRIELIGMIWLIMQTKWHLLSKKLWRI